MKNIIFAPRFTALLSDAKGQPIVEKDCDKEVLMEIRQTMSVVAPDVEHDNYRHLWFYLERGKRDDFGTFEEYKSTGLVETREQFEELWLCEFPDEKHWYHLEINDYKGNYYFYLDGDLAFHIPSEPQKPVKRRKSFFDDDRTELDNTGLLLLLRAIVTECCEWFARDHAGYHQFLNEHLSYSRRTGKILRSTYWEINPREKKLICKNLTKDDFETLAKVVEQSKKIVEQSKGDSQLPVMKEMTAAKYFHCCRLGYDANEYFKRTPEISDKDAYNAFSDGRDEGLKELSPNSERAFKKWYFDRTRIGGHPWEVCRGGTFTHVSLAVRYKAETDSWILALGGDSVSRVNETVKFAIALYNNNIPFELYNAQEIYWMVTGTDYVGIVPQEISPGHSCYVLFPKDEVLINDYMNMGWEEEEEDEQKIIEAAEWYPIKIEAAK
ncbi:hypothetical protein SAMD00024442_3_28 [Candidatus Symbiothrix dinenymphae]|nr:hypothetical protein SAMD00024442_3_28 [Candidatus Symbiothrix dinenymphae]